MNGEATVDTIADAYARRFSLPPGTALEHAGELLGRLGVAGLVDMKEGPR